MLLYVILGVTAAITRFWDLSYRALHHDESLHAYFSWLYAVGEGYVHDPLMHGPSLFHADALAFLLFGDNDYVSRGWPAALGVILVLMPALLRGPNLLGRWGALACSTLLLFSPSILYYTRYIRHDPFVLVATFAIVISALRYMERPERKWVVTIGVMSGLLFATMEVSFIVAFVLVTFVVGVVTWQVSRAAFAMVLATGVGLAAVWVILPAMGAPALPAIPWEHPTGAAIQHFTTDLIIHPMFLASLGVVLLGSVGVLGAIDRARDADAGSWLDGVLGTHAPQTTSAAVYAVLKDRRSLWISIALGLALFTVLYTSLFTNMFGLASGTVGALGYWLGQHDVQRADQPWFYYLILMAQYEFVTILLFPVAIVITAWRLIPALLHNRPVGRRTYLRGFVIYWTVVNIAVYSWAGEKMPWLSVHLVLPMGILAGSIIGAAIERIEAAARVGRLQSRAGWITGLGVLLAAGGWFLLWGWASAGPWVEQNNALLRTMRPSVSDHPWLLYIPFAVFIGIIVYSIWRLGVSVALPVLGVSGVALLLLAQVHVGFRLSYLEGDVPRDMLIYVQSSPDVTRVVSEIGTLSDELTGGKDMTIYYDSGTSWPFQWYLRDYPNRRYFGDTLNDPPDAPIVLIANDNLSNGSNQDMLSGYTATEYAMRWWFPEDETYRRFAIAPELNKQDRQNYQTDQPGPYTLGDVVGSVWHSVWGMREPQEQAKMFRMVAYREMWAPIGSYNFRVYVRNDLLPTWNAIRY
jgi:uncharacterized protein (TIGR03663 family)